VGLKATFWGISRFFKGGDRNFPGGPKIAPFCHNLSRVRNTFGSVLRRTRPRAKKGGGYILIHPSVGGENPAENWSTSWCWVPGKGCQFITRGDIQGVTSFGGLENPGSSRKNGGNPPGAFWADPLSATFFFLGRQGVIFTPVVSTEDMSLREIWGGP